MPQISQLALVYQSQWFWLVLTLLAIFVLVGRGIVPKVEATVDQRDATIAADLAAAEQARAAADAANDRLVAQDLDVRARAQGLAAEAKAKAAAATEAKLAKADAATAKTLAAAEAKIAEARGQALAGIEAVAAEAAQGIVAKVSGASVTAAQTGKTVKAMLSHG